MAVTHSTAARRVNGARALDGVRHAWTMALGAIVAGLLLLIVLFLPEAQAAVEVWNASTAYGHCYLVAPMTLYLLWERRALLAQTVPRAEARWAIGAIPIAMAWLIAERLGIMEGRQLMALAGLELLLLVVLGRRLFWMISGPLLFLVFLVPFGAFLTPALQRFTADFTVFGLQVLGIAHYADNFIIETPAGVFFVAEACAGLRFLIAAVAFGTFYALLNYTSPWRRTAFVAASIVVPIVANGLRALGIVVLGQILGSADAAAADHILYGWLFFSIVMVFLVLAGHPFREPLRPAVGWLDGASLAPARWRAVQATAILLLVLACGPAAARLIELQDRPLPFAAQPEVATPPGCGPAAALDAMPAAVARFSIVCGPRHYVMTWARYPARSTAGALVADRRRITEELGAEDVSVAPLEEVPAGAGSWSVVQTTDPDRVTAIASWVGGHPAQGGLAGRIEQARDSLLGTRFAPMMLSITTPEPPRSSAADRRAIIQEMHAIVVAQTSLASQIARLTRAEP